MFLYQTRSLILQLSGKENPQIDDVIQAFEGKLDEFKEMIEGVRLTSYKESKFLVTFKLVSNPMMGETREIVHCICCNGFETKNGIKIKTEYPSQPDDLITLYPVPFEMTDQHLKALESKGWGKITRIFFGKVRHYPQIKNGYVNIYIKEPNYMQIENKVNVFGHWMSVTTPYNRHLPMCRFCKVRGHEVENCPRLEKKYEKENQQNKKMVEDQKQQIQSPILGDFIIPKRKRSKESPENKTVKTSTPKRRRKKSKKEENDTTDESSEETTKINKEKLKEKQSIKIQNDFQQENKKEEKNDTEEDNEKSSSYGEFQTIYEKTFEKTTEITIITTNEEEKKDDYKQGDEKSPTYKDIVLNKT